MENTKPRFELVSSYDDKSLLPHRATTGSAGYDFVVAEDTVVPAYNNLMPVLYNSLPEKDATHPNVLSLDTFVKKEPLSLDELATVTKLTKAKPTLVPTGVKAYIPKNYYLQLSVRSSCPLKNWLILANGVGVIDADYYNNPDNEGHIYFQIINLSPVDIILHKGDKIGQGIFLPYAYTEDDDTTGLRAGGFGSTSSTKSETTL